MNNDKTQERPVIVCTEHRGVFFGYATDTDGDRIHLRAARMAIYFGTQRGIMQLAETGPTESSKISARANIEVRTTATATATATEGCAVQQLLFECAPAEAGLPAIVPEGRRCTPPGRGPSGETCRTCRHKIATGYGRRRYLKCGLVRRFWTHGAATDIRASWPACAKWEPVEFRP